MLLGVNRPKIGFLEAQIAGEITERALARNQPALRFRDFRHLFLQLRIHRFQLGKIGGGVLVIILRVRRVVLGERRLNILHINLGITDRHPRVRIRLAIVLAAVNGHRLDAFGNDHGRHILDIGEEALKPALQIQPVPEHQIGLLRLDQILRRRLVVVDFRAGLGNGEHRGVITGDILRHIGDNGERRHHRERLAVCREQRRSDTKKQGKEQFFHD